MRRFDPADRDRPVCRHHRGRAADGSDGSRPYGRVRWPHSRMHQRYRLCVALRRRLGALLRGVVWRHDRIVHVCRLEARAKTAPVVSHLKILKTISTTGKQVRARDKLLKPMTMIVPKSGGRVVSLRFAGIVFALFLPVTLCGANTASDFDNLTEVKTLQKGMPKDVAAFISKSAECSHWGNEEPYDKARAEFIRNAALKAGCSRLDGEEIQLRRKYRKNPKVLEIIKEAKNLAM